METVLNKDQKTTSPQGLSHAEAAERLLQAGPNALEWRPMHTGRARLLRMLREPMFVLLLMAALLYWLLGDWVEGLTLSVFVLAMLALTFVEEGRAESALQALQQLSAPKARVVRSGQTQSIPAREVVPGDVLLLAEGDRLSADGRLQGVDHLKVDESLLTGESFAVDKTEGESVWAGTHVVGGQAWAVVEATGARTQVGRMGQTLAQAQEPASPLRLQTEALVRRIAWGVAFLCGAMLLTLGLQTGDWLGAALSAIALAMATLPEEYPVVQTLFPVLGARRLAREGVLTRRIHAMETLGAVTVLCTDKTGTLTDNRMSVTAMVPADTEGQITAPAGQARAEACTPLLEEAMRACMPQALDPMEAAIVRCWQAQAEPAAAPLSGERIHTVPLAPGRPAMAQVWRHAASDRVSVKGAPETVMDLCHLPASARALWLAEADRLAAQGLRVLGVAWGEQGDASALQDLHAVSLQWLGLVGLMDPLRPDIVPAVAECQAAGIRVIMITGDYPVTARTLGRLAGLPEGDVLTGAELDTLDDATLKARMRQVSICARITPVQKWRIVQALQAAGEVVAMTGDGVNDAPALRAAHVGVAMGLRGTDVAREASALVLVDDRFASIVLGIRSGRRIFDNLQLSMRYIFAIHIPVALMALWPLFGGPTLLQPLHLALLELVIDPACAMVFEQEGEAPGVMQRPPRDPNAPLFGRADFWLSVRQGLALTAAMGLALWGLVQWTGAAPGSEAARSLVMLVLILGSTALIVIGTGRDWKRPQPLAWGLGALALLLLAVLMQLPWLAGTLKLAPLSPGLWVLAALLCGLAVWVVRPRQRGKAP